jgi:hypothetical protein
MSLDDRLVVRPRRLTRVCWLLAAVVTALFAVVAVALGNTPPGDLQFRVGDQIAMFGLGLLVAGALLLFTRPRVEADAGGVRVRNVLGEIALPWAVVTAVRLDDGSPWASLDLQDDDTVAMLAVQANDGERAVEAVLALRRLLRASRSPGAGS